MESGEACDYFLYIPQCLYVYSCLLVWQNSPTILYENSESLVAVICIPFIWYLSTVHTRGNSADFVFSTPEQSSFDLPNESTTAW